MFFFFVVAALLLLLLPAGRGGEEELVEIWRGCRAGGCRGWATVVVLWCSSTRSPKGRFVLLLYRKMKETYMEVRSRISTALS
jgi:hypothetical protein